MRMKMAVTGTDSWIKFFKDAGLPSSAAATYALTFTENRIRMDMLLDLNKEILKDMRINLMGDVIAILRHARRVHEQTACEKVLAGTPATPNQTVRSTASVSRRSSPTNSSTSDSGNSSPNVTIGDTTPKQRLTAASRMVHHYVRQTDAAGPSVDKSTKDEVPAVKAAKLVPGIKRKVKTKESAPPIKKPRRVLPEHEGRYKITMPSGSTPRTQQILAKQGLLPAKKTVFERLGEGSVSSTTESDGPLITITGLGTKIIKNNVDKLQQSSVFSRLGDKQRVTSSTAPDLEEDDQEDEDDEPSPYAGVFKLPPKKTILVKKVPVTLKSVDDDTLMEYLEQCKVNADDLLLDSNSELS
ncbi:uncharacterized protein C19orf47 isoform X2 [Anabrus simplex]|uniref:uncharacterized protein C19orf47 isoform X2 n=1 Tax=Anabrus simplex TaxID=316456 RepID=UPI0035A3D0C6